ncbi:MAG: hypothetical protein AB8G77_26265 [Rhodothermales bacterium]
MNHFELFSKLRIPSHYTAHIIEKDEVVVLYNKKRPLLLRGIDKVKLFTILDKIQQLTLEEGQTCTIQHDLLPLVALLLKQQILEYVDTKPVNEHVY